MVLSDPQWAVLLGLLSAGYFLLTIAAGTSFFFGGLGPTVSATSVWGTLAVIGVQAVPLAWRSRFPLASFWAVYLCFLAAVALSIDRNLTITPTLLFAIFSLTALTGRRVWGWNLAAAAGFDLALHLLLGQLLGGGLVLIGVLAVLTRVAPTYLAPILAGLLYGAQRRRARLESERAAALRLAAESQTAAAVAAERNRMARELHDVAAHHLSGILLQARAAIRVRDTDPATTGELLTSIGSEAELTLTNLREVIGVLREDGDPDTVPAPTLSSLPTLIASVRELHPAIDLRVHGDLDELSPAASLACFRIIQESLTNARRHAPGARVAVRLDRGPRELVVQVTNAPPDPGSAPPPGRPGYGLIGMRERVGMLGGTLDAGQQPDGGWSTRAVIPMRPVAA